MEYTEIILRLPSFAKTIEDANLINSNYVIRIIAPRSNRPGKDIFIPEPIVLRVQTDQELRFKLAPSDIYFPLGRYFVEYYKSGQSTPLHSETWVVPERKGTKTFPWLVAGIGDPITLPEDYFNSVNISWQGTYEVVSNRINWLTNPPPAGQTLSITYTAGVTLDDMIELPSKNAGITKRIY